MRPPVGVFNLLFVAPCALRIIRAPPPFEQFFDNSAISTRRDEGRLRALEVSLEPIGSATPRRNRGIDASQVHN